MFELFGVGQRRAARGGTTPLLISTATHLIVVAVLVIVPLTYVSTDLPAVPEMLAFVVSAAPTPPPPPPAPPAPKSAKASVVKSQLPARVQAAPGPAPTAIVGEAGVWAWTAHGGPRRGGGGGGRGGGGGGRGGAGGR